MVKAARVQPARTRDLVTGIERQAAMYDAHRPAWIARDERIKTARREARRALGLSGQGGRPRLRPVRAPRRLPDAHGPRTLRRRGATHAERGGRLRRNLLVSRISSSLDKSCE